MPVVTLQDRTLVAVTGEDAVELLQGLITTDIALIGAGEAWPGALLTPQGKILFEFLISRAEDGVLLETRSEDADPLIKRLTLYRLRAKANFSRSEDIGITVAWGVPQPDAAVRDMRFAKAGVDVYRSAGGAGEADRSGYDGLRHAHGISGGGEDGALTDYFPHDLLMDRNGGLSFKKGCYIGQEVVSRMQHRATARRRLVSVRAEALPPAGAAILAGDREIGALLSAHGSSGLAVVRIDKAGAALADGTSISAGGVPVALSLPAWSGLDFPAEADDAAS